jgi:tRNA G18 (ribose-2'-O)-methylase SpoU
MNVINKYKTWEVDLIRADVKANTLPYAVCMINLEHDFNFGTLIRNANAFGVRDVFYVSDSKKWDRRGAVGTHHYTDIHHLKTIEDLMLYRDAYTFVAIESHKKSVPLSTFQWPKNPMLIFGSESEGIPNRFIQGCQHVVEIPMLGSVRSLNVGTCSGIVMNDFVTKFQN